MIIAINTASSKKSAGITTNKAVIFETHWRGKAMELKKILPIIINGLKRAKKTFRSVSNITVCSGPGPFSAVRIGVGIANALGYTLNAPITAINVELFWKLRVSGRRGILLLDAGKGEIVTKGFGVRIPKNAQGPVTIEKFLKTAVKAFKKTTDFFGDITEPEFSAFTKNAPKRFVFIPETSFRTFGETILNKKTRKIAPTKTASPAYYRQPSITKTKRIARVV